MTNDDVQVLAEELITLDPIEDKARVVAIRQAIMEYEFGFVRQEEYLVFDKKSQTQIHKDFYFVPLVRKRVDADEFFNILDDLLGLDAKGEWGYKPYRNGKKANFITALHHLCDKRGKLESKLRQIQESGISNSLDERLENNTEETLDKSDFTDSLGVPRTEFEAFLRVAPLVALRKNQEKHLSKSKRSYFEGFYTFDITKHTKKGLFVKSEIIAENELLFPIMELIVLEYLLDGTFTHMRDVADNAVKDEKRLGRRYETIQVCYGIVRQTVGKKNEQYYLEFLKALNVLDE